MNICICGCEKEIIFKPKHKYYKPKFIQGHNRSGKVSNINIFSENKNTGYTRSKIVVGEAKVCEWDHIGHCKGVLDICHVDKNYMNNNKENLIVLCRSHHRLMDNGKIDFNNPIMPKFKTDKSGKRRYGKCNS